MNSARTFRYMLPTLLVGLLAGFAGQAHAQRHSLGARRPPSSPRVKATSSSPGAGVQQQAPAPIERRAPSETQMPNTPQNTTQNMPQNPPQGAHSVGPNRASLNGRSGEHLPEWMNQHRGLTLEQQQQALEREPGFHELPAPTQQRMRERLSQLSAMSPQERERIVDRTEVMERLSPQQRTEVRGAMQQLGSLPQDQRQMVARSFRELRQLPPNERMAAMNSERYRWMNEEQRTTLTNLIQVAPMLPAPQH